MMILFSFKDHWQGNELWISRFCGFCKEKKVTPITVVFKCLFFISRHSHLQFCFSEIIY